MINFNILIYFLFHLVIITNLENVLGVVVGGLKLHVELLRLGMEVSTFCACGGGDVFVLDENIASGSLIAARERDRTTEPGVILGSSSMFFI